MKAELRTNATIRNLLELKENQFLMVNPEYQRGPSWDEHKQKLLIDSILRGYQLPLFYLHEKTVEAFGKETSKFEIIDGQQRVNAIYKFYKVGGFKLINPNKKGKMIRFPKFIREAECEWADKDYSEISDELKNRFLNTTITIVNITSDNLDEPRDLFIRLQGGLPLNPQEKRDAWPGGFTDFILRKAGKENLHTGNDFFRKYIKGFPTDRGALRQLCAQIAMLTFENATEGNWTDIKSSEIDDYYYENLDFDINSEKAKRFDKVSNRISELFQIQGFRGSGLKVHEAIHLFLLVDSLLKDATKEWQSRLVEAFNSFRHVIAESKKERDNLTWYQYTMHTNTSANSSTSLEKRHRFFRAFMYEKLNPIFKDEVRSFSTTEREIIYYRFSQKCAKCQEKLSWSDCEIHHVVEHNRGGKTEINNAVPVHKLCHPYGKQAEELEPFFLEQIDRYSKTWIEALNLKFY